jgi:general stress protein YciG
MLVTGLLGTAHKLTDEERSRGGQAGGQTTAQDRRHMAQIGSKGGHIAQETGT